MGDSETAKAVDESLFLWLHAEDDTRVITGVRIIYGRRSRNGSSSRAEYAIC